MLTAAFTVTAELINPAGDGAVDSEGNPAAGYPDTGVAVRGCRFGTNASATTEAAVFQEQITTRPVLRMPPGTPVTALSRIRVMGLLYEVDGDPIAPPSTFTAFSPGPLVQLERITG